MAETRQLKVVVAGDAKTAMSALKSLGAGLSDVDKRSGVAGSGMDRLSRRVSSAAEHSTFALAGLAAAAAGLGIAFAGALDLDRAQAKFAAQLGPEQAGRLGEVAGRLYTGGFGQSMGDNMDAIRRVMSSGLIPEGTADADIERITGKALNLAEAFDQDVTQTARAAGQMVRTGLADTADDAIDQLTRSFAVTGDHAEDLLDTVSEYGTQFRTLGVDGATAMGLLSQGLQAGARDADTVADALKEFSVRAVDGTKMTADGFRAVGLDASTMAAQIGKGGDEATRGLDTVLDRLRGIEDPVKRSQAAVALFGTKAEDLGEALYALDPSEAVAAIGDVAGASDDLGKALQQSAGAQLDQFRRKVELAIVGKLTEAIPKIVEFGQWMARNREWIEPVAVGLGSLAVVLGTITVAAKIYTAVQAALNVVMLANPIGLVALALAALVAGLVYAWRNSDTFRRVVTGAWIAVRNAVAVVIGWFRTAIPQAWSAVVNATKAYWGFWRTVIRSAVNGAVAVVMGMRSRVLGALSGVGRWLRDSGRRIVQGLIDGIRAMSGRVKDAIGDVLASARRMLPFSPALEGPFAGKGWTLYSGRSIPEAMAEGVTSRRRVLVRAVQGAMGDAHDAARVPVVPVGGAAGVALHRAGARPAAPTVVVHVAGSVTAERDLARTIALTVRDEIVRTGRRNGGVTGL
ncbi:phage tail tape measure protein [Micromonospora sp. WMMA1363]|uniref:phage tail tape measure protein n=1 Tax=Micromonospora sp. WMMA1363 TaxID=3053985 RepID=UPI00259C8E95|nr:phage tail tape measure protein [Micromonospora sp. WMMA1363]MDM4721847.1 phage tail tape measure protein [Micromonospora sp. WMMA1363]